MNNLHTLTHLTGKGASDKRTINFQGIDAKKKSWVLAAVAGGVGVVLVLVLWPILGYRAVFPGAAAGMALFFFAKHRSREGMQLSAYQSLLDRKRSDAGQFYMAGTLVNPFQADIGTLRSNTVPGPGVGPEPAPAMSDELTREPALAPEPVASAPPAVLSPWAGPTTPTSGAPTSW